MSDTRASGASLMSWDITLNGQMEVNGGLQGMYILKRDELMQNAFHTCFLSILLFHLISFFFLYASLTIFFVIILFLEAEISRVKGLVRMDSCRKKISQVKKIPYFSCQ